MAYEKYTEVTPGVGVLTLEEVKTWLKVDEDGEDSLISDLIDVWTAWGQEYCWRTFSSTVWKLELEEWAAEIEIRKNPVSAVSSIQYYDTDNVQQILSTDDYKVYTDVPAIIKIEEMPSLYDRVDAVTINFTTGGSDVFKTPLKTMIATSYDNRDDVNLNTDHISPYLSMAKHLFFPFRLNFY